MATCVVVSGEMRCGSALKVPCEFFFVGNLERKTILTIGFANLVGDAFAMAVGDYLSSRAELDHANSERAREAWEIEHDPDTEKKEMVEIYVDKGLSHADAVKVVDLLFTNEDAFLNIMMMEELGIMPQDASVVPWKSAVITFVSFILFGGFPMLAYICAADYNKKADLDEIFGIAVGLLALALFGLGAYKGQVIQVPWWQSGLSMLIVGGLTTVAAYFIGDGLSSLA
ncbi:integral membrane protein, variant [Capsaspora owczarzaki ATCC 30864]|uniref:Integral membrane protein, variant n=1 Tax=Capsaspora owczarzaki (strain ATCC 30864) TaxID=595528 RepID=A0A0D2WMA3_CAPO3|nr:integral membrane protein, variant [Capsaspora owczarzaki ATCC 30864]